jgi:hypothetical protein
VDAYETARRTSSLSTIFPDAGAELEKTSDII